MIAFYIIVTIVLAIVLIIVNFYLLVLYCHPDDKGWGTSLFCKILVIMGMTLAWAQVLMLPLDAANSRGLGEGIDMDSFWKIIYMCILIMCTLLLPFAQYYYESDDEKTGQERFCYALWHQFAYLVIVSLLLFISYGFLHYADIPVTIATQYTLSTNLNSANSNVIQISSTALTGDPSLLQYDDNTTLTLDVSFPVFAMAFISFFGYCLFVIFGGVGLTALPMDMIKEFMARPKQLSSREGAQKKVDLKRKTDELLEQGLQLKEEQKEAKVADSWWSRYQQNRKVSGQFNRYKAAVLSLERDYEVFLLELKYYNTNPIVWYLKLIFGVIFAIISFLWWLQILLAIVIQDSVGVSASNFLCQILINLEAGNAGFIGTAIFAFLSLYLLWCTQKGNIKFGLRIPFIFSLHIMKENETWMNTFLFNVQLIMICSVAITQFCSKAFAQFIRNSTLSMLFLTQIEYLRFFTYLYSNNVFEIFLLTWSGLTMLYLLVKRSDKPAILVEIEERQAEQFKAIK